MPRAARIDIPNLLQHVIVRGIERRDIFASDRDRHDFISRLSNLLHATATDCLAWALLSNHFHLLLRVKYIALAKFMKRLLTGYAVTFNLRHNRSGHLFQNRYKSLVCDEEEYLLELVRYIHLNPLRAGVVASLEELDRYPWCGHSVLLGKNSLKGQATTEVLGRFGPSAIVARTRYRSFVRDGIGMGRRNDLVGIDILKVNGVQEDELKDSRVLGNGNFVEEVIGRSGTIAPARKISLDTIMEIVTVALNITEQIITSRLRESRAADARGIFCHMACVAGHRGVDIARRLKISGPAVTAAARRGKELIANHPELEESVTQDAVS